jgi:hypothetical protein
MYRTVPYRTVKDNSRRVGDPTLIRNMTSHSPRERMFSTKPKMSPQIRDLAVPSLVGEYLERSGFPREGERVAGVASLEDSFP